MRFMWGIFITCTTIRCTEGPADKCRGALKGDFIQWIPDLPLLNGHEQWPRGRFFSLWIRISPNPYLCMLGAGRFPYNSLLSGILMWACVSAFHPVMSENNVFILFQLLLCINVQPLKVLNSFFLEKLLEVMQEILKALQTGYRGRWPDGEILQIYWKYCNFFSLQSITFLFWRNLPPLN